MTKRIFVRGLSRSGGTLMVTVLDAHPQVAMSYEVYENLLAPGKDGVDRLSEFAAQLATATKKSFFGLGKSVSAKIEDSTVRTFVGRCLRGGVEAETVKSLLDDHVRKGMSFGTFRERMLFIEQLALEKARREGKEHWGAKVNSSYDELIEVFPNACFLFMLRDGRDMAASRKHVGEFNQSIEHIAEGWVKQVRQFQRFARTPGVRARMVSYDRLTHEPEAELREIIAFLDLPWDDRVLNFQDEDLSIYRNPAGHLSADQVNKPINTASIGRWKRDLSTEEIAAFEAIAGSMLMELGFELASPTMIP